MSISGKVADVSVAEVMQFIHLGRRSGTLVVESDDKKAEIGFHRGRIISAVEPKSPLLGKLLMDRGFIDKSDLVQAIHLQQVEKPRQSLGRILLAMGVITEEQIRSAVSEQIEVAICEVITWKDGTFEFNFDELRPVDDVGVSPGEILPEINLDTQMVVLEALRIFDERNRRQGAVRCGRPIIW